MGYRLAADAIVLLHVVFIAFVVLGGLLALRRPWVAAVHIPAAVWGVLVESFGWICPLTPLEVELRTAAGEAAYTGSFVDNYIVPLVYPATLTQPVLWALALFFVLVNAVIYT
ncbi:MAG: DUF2784 domain-containing protein, partial [Gammaproteobacteria bacterium]|nr:DUF2784 domain-containing protein [Gammaproteobacteria bacterium]